MSYLLLMLLAILAIIALHFIAGVVAILVLAAKEQFQRQDDLVLNEKNEIIAGEVKKRYLDPKTRPWPPSQMPTSKRS